jgi:threonine aldolase
LFLNKKFKTLQRGHITIVDIFCKKFKLLINYFKWKNLMVYLNHHSFCSDNWSGIHPTILTAIAESNAAHVPAYGDDHFTERLNGLTKQRFGSDISMYLVATGTAANVIAVSTMLKPGETALCANTAHVYANEYDVHERFSNTPFLLIPTQDGKITPNCIENRLQQDDARQNLPRLLVLTNATEFGTIYTEQETYALVECAHNNGMRVYIDGARLSNAAASLQKTIANLTVNVGVDAFSWGGTKNGLLLGEMLIFRDCDQFDILSKKNRMLAMQNASKLRFVAAQFQAFLQNDLWMQLALQANDAATLLAKKLKEYPNIQIVQKTQANQVWVNFPSAVAQSIANEHYGKIRSNGHVRLVTSWDTSHQDIEDFIAWLDPQLR